MHEINFTFGLQRFSYIINYSNNTLVSGTNDGDSIYNSSGNTVRIAAGAGNDTVSNSYGSNVTISGGAGNDSVYNSSGYYAEINTGDGCILVTKVKPESKCAMSAYDYANGAKIKCDTKFGE